MGRGIPGDPTGAPWVKGGFRATLEDTFSKTIMYVMQEALLKLSRDFTNAPKLSKRLPFESLVWAPPGTVLQDRRGTGLRDSCRGLRRGPFRGFL